MAGFVILQPTDSSAVHDEVTFRPVSANPLNWIQTAKQGLIENMNREDSTFEQSTPESPRREMLSKDDFRNTIQWRIFRIMAEFIEGFHFLADFRKTITFFGSARFKEDNPWYQQTVELGKKLADAGYTVVSGGGPGIMEAANRGAHEAGGHTLGLNIELPFEQKINPYADKWMNFDYFFSRKVMLTYSARVFVYFPGGFGTLDEFFEILTLVQTRKIPKIPLVLIGREYWGPLCEWFENALRDEFKTVSPGDLELYHLVDTVDEAFEIIEKAPARGKLF